MGMRDGSADAVEQFDSSGFTAWLRDKFDEHIPIEHNRVWEHYIHLLYPTDKEALRQPPSSTSNS